MKQKIPLTLYLFTSLVFILFSNVALANEVEVSQIKKLHQDHLNKKLERHRLEYEKEKIETEILVLNKEIDGLKGASHKAQDLKKIKALEKSKEEKNLLLEETKLSWNESKQKEEIALSELRKASQKNKIEWQQKPLVEKIAFQFKKFTKLTYLES